MLPACKSFQGLLFGACVPGYKMLNDLSDKKPFSIVEASLSNSADPRTSVIHPENSILNDAGAGNKCMCLYRIALHM